MDTPTLTGESVPADVAPGSAVFGGSITMKGLLQVEVTRVGAESAPGQRWPSRRTAPRSRSDGPSCSRSKGSRPRRRPPTTDPSAARPATAASWLAAAGRRGAAQGTVHVNVAVGLGWTAVLVIAAGAGWLGASGALLAAVLHTVGTLAVMANARRLLRFQE